MDPFIEGQIWSDFHTTFLTVVRELLAPRLLPNYVIHVEQCVWLVEDSDEVRRIVGPDLYVSDRDLARPLSTDFGSGDVTTAVALRPVLNRIPMPDRLEQHFLTIRDKRWQREVTVLELLSPWNKSRGDGRQQYLNKRLLQSEVNLVELDLLRGGVRLPTVDPLQSGDYFAFVSRPMERPGVDVYAWTLRDVLPEIPVPVSDEVADLRLELERAFTTTFDRAAYAGSLDYTADAEPRLNDSDQEWARMIVESAAHSGDVD
jgi:hypothetical protein